MSEYISSFIPGFEKIIEKLLHNISNDIRILNLYSGLVHYSYGGEYQKLSDLIYFNNTFLVYKTFHGTHITMEQMVRTAAKSNFRYTERNHKLFRVRFSSENQFVGVDKRLQSDAENMILSKCRLKLNRVNPDTEFWYLIRREHVGFYCQLLRKRSVTEKNLKKGELRPEFAYLLCCCADIKSSDKVLDPFAGSGAIPIQLTKNWRFQQLYVSDLSEESCRDLLQQKVLHRSNITISKENALSLSQLPDSSINVIITDPPWGIFEVIDNIELFYGRMLSEFARILVPRGTAVVLTAKKAEFESALHQLGIQNAVRLDTLVNGKKAGIFIFQIETINV